MLPLRPALRFSLLAAALVAANLAHAKVPASAPFTPAQQHLIRQISASEAQAQLPQVASAAAANVAKTIEGEKQAITVAKDALEVGRKSVDWWLSNISVWLGGLGLLIAVAGIGIPLWMGRKQKAEWQEKLNMLTQKLQEVEIAQQQAEAAQQKAEQHAQEIETLLVHARDKTSLIPNAETITGQLSADVLEKLHKEKPPQVVTLIEQAWDAHRRKDWQAAKPLWELLSLIEGHDSNVWFNLAYTLLQTDKDWQSKDWQSIVQCYERSNMLESDAATLENWGNALSNLAYTLTGAAQQQHFAKACDKYSEAARLAPEDGSVYKNWGSTLVAWGHTLSGEERHKFFVEACDKLAEASRFNPDDGDIYFIWGEGLFQRAKDLSGALQQHSFAEACDKFAQATRLNLDDADAYYNWGITLEDWAKTLEGEARDAKLAEAAIYKQKAEELKHQAS